MERENKIDFVIPTRHSTSFVVGLLEQASKDPWWSRHTFHFIYDAKAREGDYKLRTWLSENRNKLLPVVQTYYAPPQATCRPNLLRQMGLNRGENPYVYFQDDDDPLPINLDRCLDVLEAHADCPAVFGLTETYTPRGQFIERFPTIDAGQEEAQHLVEGLRIFPTYCDALSALFRRSAFSDVALDDGQNYQMCGINAFILALLETYQDICAVPHVIRRESQNPENPVSPVFDERRRLLLAEDINLWLRYVSTPKVRRFHNFVRQSLIAGDVSSYRDITALVEQALEDDNLLA